MAETTTKVRVEVYARETINASPKNPTQNHHRSFKLSHLDQLASTLYNPLVLFYDTKGDKTDDISRRLKASLKEILTRFYPFAGRLKEQAFVICTDDGAEYWEARVDCDLSRFLRQPGTDTLKQFVPNESRAWGVDDTGPLFLAQANFFRCGGVGLGMSICHKIADTATMAAFVNGWANAALGYPDSVTPDFSAASLFPAGDPLPAMHISNQKFKKTGKNVGRRIVFGESHIAALKAKATNSNVHQPSRVEVVSAFLWRIAMTTSRSKAGSPRPSALFFPVNMRPRLEPPLPDNAFGNLVGVLVLQAEKDEGDFRGLVHHLRRGTLELRNEWGKKLQGEDCLSFILECHMKRRNLLLNADAVDCFTISSWCRFPWYEADFGWGKPVWAAVGEYRFPNVIMLMDTRDGKGVEAWVTLPEEDMALFQSNHELLAFSYLNPSVL